MRNTSENLQATLDSKFQKTPLAEVMCKINRMRADVDPVFLPQFDRYCHEVEVILWNASNEVLQDQRVSQSVDQETENFVRKSNLAGVKAELQLKNAANDDSYLSDAA